MLLRLLGRRLRAVRQDRELLLKDAAEQSGISLQFLSDCERGERLPSLEKLLALAETYDVLFTELVSDVYPFDSTDRPRRSPGPPPDGRRAR